MAKFINWLKSASTNLIDPNREAVLADHTHRIEDALFRDPNSFDLDRAARSLGVLPENLPAIVQRIYRRATEKVWSDVSAASQGIEIRSSGKGTGLYAVTDPELVHAVLSVAVSRANQTIVYQGTEGRHIPRDVRQRVWQRYGGRCAQCGATQYLEFDHIVPHAKGGNNGDKNVQLLCRGCNAKKSDFI